VRPFEEPPSAHLFGTSAALYQVRAIYSYSILCAVESSLYGHFGLLERPGKGKKKREKERAVVTAKCVAVCVEATAHSAGSMHIFCTIYMLYLYHTCLTHLRARLACTGANMYACVHMYIQVRAYMHTHVHVCICMCVRMYDVCMHACIYVCICQHMYTCKYVCAHACRACICI